MSDYTRKTPARGRMLKLAAALMVGTAASAISITPAHAQQSQASLRGTITNGGAPLATSQVTAIEVATGYRRVETTAADGSYLFASLRPGTYKLEVETPNGTRSTDQFTLSVAQNAQLDFDVQPTPAADETPAGDETAAAGDEIIVTGNRIRSMEGGEVGVTISQRLIEQLPQNNRNFLAFADLAPGVQLNTGSNGNVSIQGGAQDSRTVNIFIDGVGQKDYVLKNGITGQDSSQGNPFPQLAVGEYRVISSNYKAEFDQVSSVAITAVTKSGTNEFHGEVFGDFTNQDLRAKTPNEKRNDEEKTKTKDFQFGGALGGPIIKDLLHFFVTYEGKRQQIPIDILRGNTNYTGPLPAETEGEFGSFNRTFNEDLYFGKLDFVPSDRDLFEVSLKVRKETAEGIGSGSALRNSASDIKNDEYRGLFRYQRTNDNWVNDFKVTYEDASWAPTPRVFERSRVYQDEDGQQIYRIGGSANYQDKGQKGWSVQDDFTYTGVPGHAFKVGVKAKWVTLNTLQLNYSNPSYTYNAQYDPGDPAFNDVIPYKVQFGLDSGIGDPRIESKNFQLGLYAQDDWEVTDRFTAYLGIRWDYDRTPAYLNYVTPADQAAAVSPENYPNLVNSNIDISDYISNGHNRSTFMGAFQPRLGFSWEMDDSGRFTLFGGYGRSYDRDQFDFLQQEIAQGSFTVRTVNFQVPGDDRNDCDPGLTCVPWDPVYLTQEGLASLANGIPGGARELRFVNNDLKVPYSDQFSLGVRGRFGSNVETEVGYMHIDANDGFAYLLANRRPNGAFFEEGTTEGQPWSFAPEGYGNTLIGTNGIHSISNSVYAKFVKNYTPDSPWSLNATYTFTAAKENRKFGEYFSLDYPSLDAYPFLTSTGVSRHRFVAAGTVDIPFGFTFSSKLTLASPPYIQGRGLPGEEFGNRELRVIEGNNKHPFILGDLWAKRQLDLALTKYVPLHFISSESKLRFRVDVLNVLNTANYVDYNGNGTDDDPTPRSEGGNGSFGDLSAYGIGGNPPRTIKLSVGYAF